MLEKSYLICINATVCRRTAPLFPTSPFWTTMTAWIWHTSKRARIECWNFRPSIRTRSPTTRPTMTSWTFRARAATTVTCRVRTRPTIASPWTTMSTCDSTMMTNSREAPAESAFWTIRSKWKNQWTWRAWSKAKRQYLVKYEPF